SAAREDFDCIAADAAQADHRHAAGGKARESVLAYQRKRARKVHFFSISNASSLSCLSSTSAGAPVIRQDAFCTLGKAMTSLMLSVPVMIITRRSSPNAS